MAPTRRPKKPNVSSRQKPKHNRAATDLLVNPGNPPHRHQTCAKADSTRAYHRMVILAQSPPGCRSARSLQKKATVVLGKVGAVAAREVSRFARNSRDWQQLIEMCRVVDTVLIDQETVYAPRQGNDRLLLGLKGSLNEYELDLLRHRSLSARYEKARRGELIV